MRNWGKIPRSTKSWRERVVGRLYGGISYLGLNLEVTDEKLAIQFFIRLWGPATRLFFGVTLRSSEAKEWDKKW
jgi:hypothetical protein